MWHGVLCYLFVDLPPPPLPPPSPPQKLLPVSLSVISDSQKTQQNLPVVKPFLGQKKHVKSFSFIAAFSPFYKVNWPSHYLSWCGSTLPRRGRVDGLLAQPLSCLRQRLSPSCGPERPRTLHAGLTIDRGKQHRWPLFFQPLFRFFSFAFSTFIPFLSSWWCFAANLRKRKMARDQTINMSRKKKKCKREQRKRNTITVITLNVWKAGRPDQHLSKRRGEREGAGQTVKPALRLVCTVPLPTCFFLLYMHICAFLALQVL